MGYDHFSGAWPRESLSDFLGIPKRTLNGTVPLRSAALWPPIPEPFLTTRTPGGANLPGESCPRGDR
jgi:hypothetical protein